MLHCRFDRRLLAVIAAPGFGKTTVLAQAVAENSVSPAGEDRWLTCHQEDSALSALAAGVYAAVGISEQPPDDPREAALVVADAIWSAAPKHVALILDDSHLIPPGSSGSEFLAQMLSALPHNGHLVLGARPPLPVMISRIVASGDAVVVREADLKFNPEELNQFASLRGVPQDLFLDIAGWPALAELTATSGQRAIGAYVWEEILSRLSPDRRRALAMLAAVGGADDEIATALLGRPVKLDALLDGLPLVSRAPNAWWSLHALWSSALDDVLTPAELSQAQTTAAALLRGRRQYQEAMTLLMKASAWDAARELIVDVCEVFTALVPIDVLAGWLQRLPLDVAGSPEGLLLAAMVVEPTNPAAGEELLARALADDTTLPAVRFACINAMFLIAFWRSDRQRMVSLLGGLEELHADGHADAEPLVALLRALLSVQVDQVRAELAVPSLANESALSPVADWLLTHMVLLKLGDPARAEPLARHTMNRGMPTLKAVARCELIEALRLLRRVDEAEQLLPELLEAVHTSAITCSPELLTCAVVSLDTLGREQTSTELLRDLEPTIASSPVAWARVAWATAQAFHLVSEGAEAKAVETLHGVLGDPLARSRTVIQVSPAAFPLLYVLVPDVRRRWDEHPLPGSFAQVYQVVRALVELREFRSLTSVRALDLGLVAVAETQLPRPWTVELRLAMVAAGRADARHLLENVGAVEREVLRAQVNSPLPAVANASRSLLREIPPTPTRRLHLRVLGRLELLSDGAQLSAPQLRRERVRHLLGYLLVHPRTTRLAASADLWPDLDEGHAAHNLRVTLTYLQHLLQPERDELDPPYFVRSSGPVLQLVLDEWLQVDAVDFDRHVDEARVLDQQRAPSSALESYRKATELWTGEYLVDIGDSAWLQFERDRLRGRFISSALRAGDLLLALGDAGSASRLASRVLQADEFSESAYQLLIAAYLAIKDRTGASRQLRRCADMLRNLGVAPQPATRALAERIAGTAKPPARAGAR